MARPNRKDRGLLSRTLSDGRVVWYVRLYHRGLRRQFGSFQTKTEAREFYEKSKSEQRAGRFCPDRYHPGRADLFDRVVVLYLAQIGHKKTATDERTKAEFWLSWFKGQRPLDITPLSIERARVHLLSSGNTFMRDRARQRSPFPLTHATVNRYVAWLKHVLMIEERAGRLPVNPCRSIQKFKERKPPEEFFTEDEEARISSELGPYADCPALAILTGLREAELFSLQWKWLDLDKGQGAMPDTKGGEPQVFLINQDAKSLLNARRMLSSGSPWVFPRPDNPALPINGKSWYRHVFRPACLRAGIVLDRKSGKTFHTLRHTFAARLQDRGVEVKDIKDLGRWKSWQAMSRYLKRDQRRLRSAIEALRKPTSKNGTAMSPPLVATVTSDSSV